MALLQFGKPIHGKKSSLVTGPVQKIVSTSGNESIPASSVALVLVGGTPHKVWLVSSGTQGLDDKGSTDLDSTANSRVIATAGQGDFAGVNRFYDIALVAEDGSTELYHHLLIATDKGLYISTRQWGIYHSATAADAGFVKVDATPIKHITMPQRARGSQHFWTVKDKSTLYQWGVSASDAGTRALVPSGNFNASAGFSSIENLKPLFYSNGALRLFGVQDNQKSHGAKPLRFDLVGVDVEKFVRRLAETQPFAFVIFNGSVEDIIKKVEETEGKTIHLTIFETTRENYTRLDTLPYQVGVTDANISRRVAIPDDPARREGGKIYWIGDAGAGYTMAGTAQGVISLE